MTTADKVKIGFMALALCFAAYVFVGTVETWKGARAKVMEAETMGEEIP